MAESSSTGSRLADDFSTSKTEILVSFKRRHSLCFCSTFNFHQHSDVKGSKRSSSVENYLKTTDLSLHGLVKVTFLTHWDFLSQRFLSVASWSLVFGALGLGAVESGVEGGIATMGCRPGSADTGSAFRLVSSSCGILFFLF